MSEIRDTRTTVNLEATYKILMQDICNKANITTSDYLRLLVISDLDRRGLLSKHVLLHMAGVG